MQFRIVVNESQVPALFLGVGLTLLCTYKRGPLCSFCGLCWNESRNRHSSAGYRDFPASGNMLQQLYELIRGILNINSHVRNITPQRTPRTQRKAKAVSKQPEMRRNQNQPECKPTAERVEAEI
jgi:hypothetical protein